MSAPATPEELCDGIAACATELLHQKLYPDPRRKARGDELRRRLRRLTQTLVALGCAPGDVQGYAHLMRAPAAKPRTVRAELR